MFQINKTNYENYFGIKSLSEYSVFIGLIMTLFIFIYQITVNYFFITRYY